MVTGDWPNECYAHHVDDREGISGETVAAEP